MPQPDTTQFATPTRGQNNGVTRGRCMSIDPSGPTPQLILQNLTGFHNLAVQTADCAVGDIVEIQNGSVRVLTPNRSGLSPSFAKFLEPRRRHAMAIRARVESGIREFFESRDFLETRTPLLVPSPGMEPHIRPFRVSPSNSFLPTSPEFSMKRLLVGGLEKIFQICPAFRDEPMSFTHSPEFTMLEWYRAYAGYEDIMRDTEELFESLALKISASPKLNYQGREISVKTPWPRLLVRDLFQEHAGIDLTACGTSRALASECVRLGIKATESENWDDLYFKIWLNVIEPKLPVDRAVFVMRYPVSQAALSVIDQDPDGTPWARRFEVYAAGIELGNAFEELTDPGEQRNRFEKDMRLRAEIYGPEFPTSPIDEGFLDALAEGMPPSGGIAVGVDRMVMLFADEPDIERCFWLGHGTIHRES